MKQVFDKYQEVDSKIEQIARLRELATSTTTIINGMPKATHSVNFKVENAIIHSLDEPIYKLNEELKVFIALYNEVSNAIAQIKERDERIILEYRYLAFKSWQDIAQSMNLSKDRIFQLHRMALEKITANYSELQ